MCRHLAYLGPPVAMSDLLFGAPHALVRQARCPRHQPAGTTNADGWGVAWYPEPDAAPLRHRTASPMWDDSRFAARAPRLRCGAFLAAARWASPGATIEESGNAPFVDGRWAFSLNGIVYGFTEHIGDHLRGVLSPSRRDALAGDADTEVLFALVCQHLEGGDPPDEALVRTVDTVLGLTTARLNLLLTDGSAVYATRVGNSLFRRGAVIASEPTDDLPGWCEVPDHTVVVLTPDGTAERPL